MSPQTPDVLIVGAGPTGLSLALTLLMNGISVRIINKANEFIVGNRGSGMQPRTQELLKLLDVWEDMEKFVVGVFPLRFHTGTEVQTKKFVDIMGSQPQYYRINPWSIGQDEQERIYRDHLKKRFGVEVELGVEFVSMEQHPDHVEVQLVKHATDGAKVEEAARFAWVVGADGGKSQVRKELDIQFLGETVDQGTAVMGDVHVTKMPESDQQSWNVWGNPPNDMATLRAIEENGDRHSFILAGKEMDVDKVSSSKEEFVKAFYKLTGRTDIEFGDLLALGTWRLNIRMAETFRKGRVFLAGDAAHSHSPTGGQGMNSSVQDAVNLGWKLALVHKGICPSSLLDSYSDERVPVIAAMLGKTTELFRQTTDAKGTAGSRQQAWHRGFELRMFGINYRTSSLIVDERHPEKTAADPYRAGDEAHGGDRAPEAPGLADATGKVTSLYEIFKPTVHTVLIFDGPNTDTDAVLNFLSNYPPGTVQSVIIHSSNEVTYKKADFILQDRDGYAYKHYRIEGEDAKHIVVVRPDAFIGALVGGVDGLGEYFGGLGWSA